MPRQSGTIFLDGCEYETSDVRHTVVGSDDAVCEGCLHALGELSRDQSLGLFAVPESFLEASDLLSPFAGDHPNSRERSLQATLEKERHFGDIRSRATEFSPNWGMKHRVDGRAGGWRSEHSRTHSGTIQWQRQTKRLG
jgi:hypothetical protein